MNNYIEDYLKNNNLKIYEEFKILNENNEIVAEGCFKVNDNYMLEYENNTIDHTTFIKLLKNEYKIKKIQQIKTKMFKYTSNFDMSLCTGNTAFIIVNKEGKLIANNTPFEWGINEICLHNKSGKILYLSPQDILDDKYDISVINYKNNRTIINNNINKALIKETINIKKSQQLNNVISVTIINKKNNTFDTYQILNSRNSEGLTIMGANNKQYFMRYDVIEKDIILKLHNKKRKLDIVLFKENGKLIQYEDRYK